MIHIVPYALLSGGADKAYKSFVIRTSQDIKLQYLGISGQDSYHIFRISNIG